MTMSCPAMYSSWRRAMRSPSSRGMAWCELASGSSRTRYVEAFERASTSVCTLRLSYLVRRAFGILAASPLSSSAEGLTRTDLASGSGDICLAIWWCQLLSFASCWRLSTAGSARVGYPSDGRSGRDPRLCRHVPARSDRASRAPISGVGADHERAPDALRRRPDAGLAGADLGLHRPARPGQPGPRARLGEHQGR